MEFHTLKPGLLVSMNTSVRGNVSYHEDERDVKREERTEITDIRTRKTVIDVEEQERAIKVRTKIRGLILSVCTTTAFSNTMLCPNDREQDLRDAIALARKMTDEFNAEATTTAISFYIFTGRIAQDDIEVVRAITGEIRQLIENMQEGLKAMDPKAIRDAANKAKTVSAVLQPEAQSRLQVAIDTARQQATKLAKAGDVAAKEVDRLAIKKIQRARTAFLDIEIEASEVQQPKVRGRNIDLA